MNQVKDPSPRRIGAIPIITMSAVLIGIVLAFYTSLTPNLLDSIRQDSVLRIATRNGPTTYYQEQGTDRGFEYELAYHFALRLGVELEIVSYNDLQSLVTTTSLGGVHMAAAGFADTPKRREKLAFSDPYFEVDAVVVYRAGEAKPRGVEDLINKSIAVIANSSHAEALSALQIEHPALFWDELNRLESIDFLEMVRDFHYDYAVVDSNEFAINRELFPSLSTGMRIGEPQPLSWAVMKGDTSKSLLQEINLFLAEAKQDGTLDALISEYFDPSNDMSRGSAQTFTRRVEDVLPKYIDMIKRVAQEANIDWPLLAAIAYQESHWDPKAKSPTGVRGMMMLTQITANEMGITNRLDAEQSLRGGIAYFKKIHERLPARITEPDRTELALAAYNVGLGHLEDARVITQRQGKNPDLWEDVKQHLPLLQKRRWYSKTKFGYARGQEPVDYVTNIRRFESYLRWHEVSAQNRRSEETLNDDAKEIPLPLNSGIDVL
ncbi:MAG TPA: membrane-bound lytic murein transglycosylase MltF [Pseudomonadales bacterium]|nr:membrane-bound lytic murein transglycosylase MltF [Pseudomonadales bacterium]